MALQRATVVRNLWASPAMFVYAAGIVFILDRERDHERLGWSLYLAGWLPPLIALVWCAARQENPGIGGLFALTVLLSFGLLFWLNNG
ncbi:hypothetical protein ABZ714_30935 [Streptomyces sp. NPDC006798]|uniref:hypothetical protein n=1 Tax=Streptomyces sp. NPDC006798 TaxID=3155462 RepID=UPI0033FAF0DD